MSFSHKITEQWAGDGRSVSAENTFTEAAKISLSEAIAADANNYEIALNLDVSEIVCIYIKCDQDVTVETNDGDSPDDTLTLKAGVPYIWHENSYHDCLLDTDITSLFVTNDSDPGTAATLEIEVLYDPTPDA